MIRFLLASTLLLTGCNDMQQSKPMAQKSEKYTATSVLLSGKVVGDTGNVEAVNMIQNVITSATVQNGHYKIEIPAQTQLPIILHYKNFISVIVDTDITSYDINDLTTSIAQKAKTLGGYTRQNMILASSDSVHTPDANKVSTGWRGDTTKQYGGWH